MLQSLKAAREPAGEEEVVTWLRTIQSAALKCHGGNLKHRANNTQKRIHCQLFGHFVATMRVWDNHALTKYKV